MARVPTMVPAKGPGKFTYYLTGLHSLKKDTSDIFKAVDSISKLTAISIF